MGQCFKHQVMLPRSQQAALDTSQLNRGKSEVTSRNAGSHPNVSPVWVVYPMQKPKVCVFHQRVSWGWGI